MGLHVKEGLGHPPSFTTNGAGGVSGVWQKRVKIFIIKLMRFPERRTFMEADLRSVGIAAEFVAAIDGSRGEHEEISRYDERQCLRRFGAPLFPAEIACFASHHLLWQAMLGGAGTDYIRRR
jgi:GR25 family glycosyltransferase involved in LPS biosynthesis